jgi:hypothetical protein
MNDGDDGGERRAHLMVIGRPSEWRIERTFEYGHYANSWRYMAGFDIGSLQRYIYKNKVSCIASNFGPIDPR